MEQPSLGAKNGCSLFVGNLSPRITECELRAMVEPFGTVLSINMGKVHSVGVSCGFGFVEMTNGGAAARAIAELNGKSIDGRCLRVRLGF